MNQAKKIVHLTSAHPRYDTRIFVKICSSLSKHGYPVELVVADGLGDEIKNGVRIVDSGDREGRRLARMRKTTRRVFEKGLQLDASIYHLHDPELIPIGLKLKRLGKTVIFDAHEDLPEQIRNKPYLGLFLRAVLSNIFRQYEKFTCSRFDGVVAATPRIAEKFSEINTTVANINNYPKLEEFKFTGDWTNKSAEATFLGGIAEIRGIKQIVQAIGSTQGVRLNLAGEFSEASVEREVKTYAGWRQVNELGYLNRIQVNDLLARSMIGLVTLLPVSNYLEALPVKMFEYMAAGIPVIASNFPLWREIIEDSQSGICVDPLDSEAIAEAIEFLINNPGEAQEMGRNGRLAVEQKYNWAKEEIKLLEFYNGLLN